MTEEISLENNTPETNIDPIEALQKLLEKPFDEQTLEVLLPVVRNNPSEEAKKILHDLLETKFEAPAEYYISGIGLARQNTEGPYNHLSQIAALLLLEEWNDPDVMELLLHFIKGEDAARNGTIFEFGENMARMLLENEAIKHPEKLNLLAEYVSMSEEDPMLREAALDAWVHGAEAAGLSEEERRSTLAPWIQNDIDAIKADKNVAFATGAAHHWGYEDMLEEAKEAFHKYSVDRPMTPYEALFEFDHFDFKVKPVKYEDYADEGAMSAGAYLDHGEDGEALMKQFSQYSPKLVRSLSYMQSQGMSEEEVAAYVMSDPELYAEMRKLADADGSSASKAAPKKARPKAVKNSLASTRTPGASKKKKKKKKK